MTNVILLLLILWLAHGYSPGRVIKKERQRHHTFGIGKMLLFFIDGDKGIPFFPRPLGFTQPLIEFTFKKLLLPGEKVPTKNSVGDDITSHGDPIAILGTDLRTVILSDKTTKIRKRNVQALVINANFPSSSLDFKCIFSSVFIVKNPMKLIKLDSGILKYSQGEIEDAISPWFAEQESEWEKKENDAYEILKRSVTNDPEKIKMLPKNSLGVRILIEMQKLRIDNITSIPIPFEIERADGTITTVTLPFKKYLNEKKFEDHGYELGEISLKIGYAENVKKIADERAKQQSKLEERNTAITNEGLRIVQRETQTEDAIANNEAAQNEWPIQKEKIEVIAEAQRKANSGFGAPQVLVIGGENNNQLVNTMIGTIAGNSIKPKTKPEKEVTDETTK